jgi:2-polyprenyl-3-methyl-5-hydroxy-6-metoxy-1,4-benzoquinol methylase
MQNPAGDYLTTAYGAKVEDYFASARREWIDPLPVNPSLSILEVGCGAGATGALALKDRKCGIYVGIEMFAAAAQEARKFLTQVHLGNVDTIELPFAPESFDILICGDVLEHLVDPQISLGRLFPLLKRGGAVITSVPNIAHWEVVLGLVQGRFDYTNQGVMDHTHLRWFTPGSLRRLFEGVGFEVERVEALGWKSRSRTLTAPLPFRHLLWRQIDLRGRRPVA